MGSPTSDDDETRRVAGPGGWGPPGPRQGGPQYPGPPSPPPVQGGHPPSEQPTTPLPPSSDPGDQRGQTAQFPQVGGYPPGGPGPYAPGGPGGPYPPGGPGGPYPPQGPYGYGPPPGGPPPGGGRSRRGLVIALAVGLVILAGIGVALIFAFTRDEGETVSADPTGTTSAAPTSSASSTPTPTESATSAPSTPTETAGNRTDELLAVVPPDFSDSDCAETDLAGDGDVAAVRCGASATQPGPQSASFYLYDDTGTLDEVFASDAEDFPPMPEGEDCSTAEGVTIWNVDEVEGGEIACSITDDGLLIAWTDREFGIEGVVTAPGSTQEELAELADWWRSNSDFQR